MYTIIRVIVIICGHFIQFVETNPWADLASTSWVGACYTQEENFIDWLVKISQF